MKQKKILFIIKKRIDEYGKSYGLINSASFVSNYLEENGFASNVVEVKDANEIDREVTKNNPDIVIIEAIWVTPQKIKELFSIERHKKRVWIVRIHSKLSFLANEGIAMDWIGEYNKIQKENKDINFIIAPNVNELTEDFNKIYKSDKFVFLPNIYFPKKYNLEIKENIKNKDEVNIGCFGAIRPMKNHLPQAVAAIEFGDEIGKKIRFHINANRIEQKGEQVFKNLINLFKNTKHELVLHDWMNHQDFINLVKQMDFGMQVSLTETFNIVAADFVYNEVPIVVSKDIEWMPFYSKANPNSTDSIKNKIYLNCFFENVFVKKINKHFLITNNQKSGETWKEFILSFQKCK
jgi:hypothetical protein